MNATSARPARAFTACRASIAGRLVIVIGEHGSGVEPRRQRGDGLARAAVEHHEAAAAPCELLLQLAHAVPDELDAAVVAAGEAIEDFAVENERAMDAPALRQRRVQRGVIETAQIAPEPHHRVS